MANDSIVVIVNNEFWKDPRVSRTVFSITDTFEQIHIISGVVEEITKRKEQYKNVTIHRHRFFKPTYGQSKITKWATALATTSGDEPEPSNKVRTIWQAITLPLKSILFFGWLFFLLAMNLIIVIRYRNLKGSIYYANDLDTLLSGYLLSKLYRAKLVYDAHELYPDLFETGPKSYRLLLNKLERFLANKASVVITVNDSIADILQTRHTLQQKPTVVLNCPVFQTVQKRSAVSYPPYKILYHGIYLPGRNLEGIVLSMRYVENAELYLRGYGILEEPLKELVKQHKLQDKVFFVNPVPMPEMVSEAATFDIGIVPYPGNAHNLNSYYCTPNKIFEYMMAGLALVVSDLPELRHIVNQYEVGILFDPAVPESIGQALKSLSPEELQQMQVNALKATQTVFNFEHEAQKLRYQLHNLG